MAYRVQDTGRILKARRLIEALRPAEGEPLAARTRAELAVDDAALRAAALTVRAEEADDEAPRLARDAARELLQRRLAAVVRSLKGDLALQVAEGEIAPGLAATLARTLDGVLSEEVRARTVSPERLLVAAEGLTGALGAYPFAAERLRLISAAATALTAASADVRREKVELEVAMAALVAARARIDQRNTGAGLLLRALSNLDPRFSALAAAADAAELAVDPGDHPDDLIDLGPDFGADLEL
jgi:hypothetical protein